MMRKQCLLGLRTFVAFAAKPWSFFIYLLRRQIRTVIQYETVQYDILPLSPLSRNRLAQVKRRSWCWIWMKHLFTPTMMGS